MSEITADVNWLAMIVGAVVAFLMGWAWYSPKLFGKKWAEGVGLSLDDPVKPPAMAMIFQALGTLGLAWVVAVTAKTDALMTIILIVITFVLIQISGGFFIKKSGYAIATDAGYIVAMAVIMFAAHVIL